MKKILGIIIFLAVVVGGGYYVFANYIVSEKERVIEAFGNTLNLKEYTSETVVGVNLSGVELTEQEMEMLNSLKLGVRTAVNEEKIEAYLILKATLNYDGYVSEYPLDLQIGTQIDIKNKTMSVDFSKLLKVWNEFSNEGYLKIADSLYENEGLTKDEFKAGLDEINVALKEVLGENVFEENGGYVLSFTFEELENELGVEMAEIEELIKNPNGGDLTAQEQRIMELAKAQVINVINMLSEEMFKEKAVSLNYDQIVNIITNVLNQEDVKKEILNLAKEEGEEVTEEDYKEMLEQIKPSLDEMKTSLGLKDITFGFSYDINKKEKIFNTYNSSIHVMMESGENVTVNFENKIQKGAVFAFPTEAKKVTMAEFEDAMNKIGEKIGYEEESYSDEVYTWEETDENFATDAIYQAFENSENDEFWSGDEMVLETIKLPLEFITEEESISYQWQQREEVTAADGNVYVNYYYDYTDPSNGHFQKVTKQTIKNVADGTERVLVYYKETGFAGGQVYKENYQLLWDELGEYHSYTEGYENAATMESSLETIEGRYDANSEFVEK